MSRIAIATIALITTLLSACATDGERNPSTRSSCMDCGEIMNINPVSNGVQAQQPLGGQSARILTPTRNLGMGSRSAADPLGVPDIAGAADVPVYRIHDGSRLSPRAEVLLKMDDGEVRRLLIEDARGLNIGDRVRVVGNRLMPTLDDSGDGS